MNPNPQCIETGKGVEDFERLLDADDIAKRAMSESEIREKVRPADGKKERVMIVDCCWQCQEIQEG